MVLQIGKHEFRFKKFKHAPVREQMGVFGKVAESRSFIDFGWEESLQFRSWFLIVGKAIFTYRMYEMFFKPSWVSIPTPPPERPSVENVITFKGKKK